jgi:PAS domain S-box-containing protein
MYYSGRHSMGEEMSNSLREKNLSELIDLCKKILEENSPKDTPENDAALQLIKKREELSATTEDAKDGAVENKQLLKKLIPVLLKIALLTCIFFSIYEGIKQLVFADLILWQSHIITIVFAALVASFGAYFPLRQIEILYQKSVNELAARRRAQAVLKESEERYRQLFELESDALFLIDEKTDQILEVNAAGEKLYGFKREEFLNMKKEELIDKRIDSSIGDVEQEFQNDFIFHRRNNGSIFPVEISFSRVNWYGKKVRLSAIRDITERLNAQQKIERHRAFLKNVMDANPNFIYVIDKENRIVHANRTFADILGMSPEQLIGKKVKELPPDLDFVNIIQKNEISIISHEKDRIEGEEHFIDSQGNPHWILSIMVPLKNEEGNIEQLIGVCTDITQRKQAEDDLKTREIELEMKSKNLEEVNTALKVLLKQREADKKEMEEMFLTNVKDQVIPYIEKLKKIEPNTEQRACIETMEAHLNDIISPFLKSITSKYVDLTPKEIQVASLIKDGKTTKEIGLLLNISPGSVDLHRYHIRKKLGINKQDVNLRSYLFSLP